MKLRIKPKYIQQALEIFNHLHTDEMLLANARGKRHPPTSVVRDSYWYSWVNNPENPYSSLTEAFKNWDIVDEDININQDDTTGFTISGWYHNKLGQQDFLIQKLAPVLSNTDILVIGEDGSKFHWIVKNHIYSTFDEKNNEESSEECS
ncbi:MAG: hypothetical protein WD512_11400, partial [Candidatus Paceibacterota bacterium]